ncbi:peptide chain release factor 3 [Synechococcus sp. RS9916]|nr:peptide chain release factor 3 [Synechococcus sp. RS9916]
MPVTETVLEVITPMSRLSRTQRQARFDQRHLRGEVVTLKDLDFPLSRAETDVINPAVITGTVQPDGVHHRGSKKLKKSGEPPA